MALIKTDKLLDLDDIESLIKRGLLNQARSALQTLSPKKISPVDLVFYCSLLRRAGLSVLAIKTLQPLVYPSARKAMVATSDERLEYASCLVRLGILNEAERIFRSIDSNMHPVVLIRLGFLFISRWDFQNANECFKAYVAQPKNDPYEVLIGKVNLLQGFVNLRELSEAEALADQLSEELDPVQNRLLLAAVYEFRAEVFRLQRKFSEGLKEVARGKALLAGDHSLDEFLLRKQEAIIAAHRTRDGDHLLTLRAEAAEWKHFESLRDLDLHRALITKDVRLLEKVYWGTQSKAYKKRILELASIEEVQVRSSFYQFHKNKGIVFNVETGALVGAKAEVKKEKLLSKLLRVFVSESYKPLKISDLFSGVYEQEIFFPESSPDKMHQLLRRLQSFIIEAELPLSIVCKGNAYRLLVHGNFSLSSENVVVESWERSLKKSQRRSLFDAEGAQALWNCSRRTAFRRLLELKERGRIEVIGKTRSARYRFR